MQRTRYALLAALLPQTCLLCGETAPDQPLCPACAGELPLLTGPYCPQCALPTAHGESCGACLRQPPAFDAVHTAFRYAFPLDALIREFKYHGQFALAGFFAANLLPHLPPARFDGILPMPLHPQRLQERGFNQAKLLAQPLARARSETLDPHSCQRLRPTPPQAQTAISEKRNNVRNAFFCNQDLSGLRLLLVDDVLTSGATAHECARTLKLHGAERVDVAVVARAG
ncbi:MAG: hypothetical protein RIR00_73 [Pseudomonadota bacterium]|jgi:ComF family protein